MVCAEAERDDLLAACCNNHIWTNNLYLLESLLGGLSGVEFGIRSEERRVGKEC